jgi:hypothetical protein
MKKAFILLCLLLGVHAASAQSHDDHTGHSHDNHSGHSHDDHNGHSHDADHNPADESPAALFEDMAAAIAAQPGERVLHKFTGLVPRFGMAVQKNLFAEAGLSLDFYSLGYTGASEYVSFGYSNLRPYIAGEIMVGQPLIGGGKAGVEYIRSTPVLGMAFGADVSYLTGDGANAVLLTPRLMLSLVHVELFYGYNIFLRNQLSRWVGHHRLGVSMTLNSRFWKRKKTIYEDYYNTYIE